MKGIDNGIMEEAPIKLWVNGTDELNSESRLLDLEIIGKIKCVYMGLLSIGFGK